MRVCGRGGALKEERSVVGEGGVRKTVPLVFTKPEERYKVSAREGWGHQGKRRELYIRGVIHNNAILSTGLASSSSQDGFTKEKGSDE